MAKQGDWVAVDVEGRVHSLAAGDRAGRIEFDGSTFRAKVGRRRGSAPRLYWTWQDIGEFADLGDARASVETRIPAGR